jgi:DNA-binding NarL/FixJ family response regulator
VVNETAGDQYLTERFRQSANQSAPSDSCAACGAVPPAASGQAVNGIVLRAALPQPIAGALLLARTLSPRERTVFQFLGLGYGNRSIAREMRVSERTVKRHVTLILTKLKLESRLQAGLTALITFSATPAGTDWPESRMDPSAASGDTG